MSTFIPGTPVPQPRPRAVRFKGGSGIRMYEPANATKWKATVKAHMLALELTPMEGACQVDLDFRFVRPKSHFTSKGLLAKGAPAACTLQRCGDADNLGKAVLDACNGVLYRDDAQVTSLIVTKTYAKVSGVQLVWREL